MTLSLQRPDDRGGLRSMEKWANSGWGNQHPILEPSMNPLFFPHASSQSMFPQLMEQHALVQAFVEQQANADQKLLDSPHSNNNNNNSNSLDTLLMNNNSSKSSSMVDSTSDDDCTVAPENLQVNSIAALGGGSMSPVLQASMLDRTASTGTSLMNAKDFFSMESPSEERCVATLKRRLEEDEDEDEGEWGIHGAKLPKVQEAFAEMAFADTTMPPPPPFLGNGGSSSSPPLDVDKIASMRAILFRHASQPIPSLEEIASTRPKRRNVRISKDPQSVAARLRRERISDRIRVLQRLVPGGTKMDTASMLDEAIHYVKFLKLQLQALEQIGNNNNKNNNNNGSNNCDPRGFVQPSLVRPFDLNCAQAWPAAPMVNNLLHPNAAAVAAAVSSLQQQQQQQSGLSASWTSSEANRAFSDAMQEQFCH